MSFINRKNIGHRFVQLLILMAHLFLLAWILYTLYEGGILPFRIVLFHFLGISIYGGLLIRTCAYIYKRQYIKELEQNAKNTGHLDS